MILFSTAISLLEILAPEIRVKYAHRFKKTIKPWICLSINQGMVSHSYYVCDTCHHLDTSISVNGGLPEISFQYSMDKTGRKQSKKVNACIYFPNEGSFKAEEELLYP